MESGFYLIATLTLLGALGAMWMKNLVHCALSLAVGFLGLSFFYFQLGAQFLGLAQILVYIGAVAILIVFAILLTRNIDSVEPLLPVKNLLLGSGIAGVVGVVLLGAILPHSFPAKVAAQPPEVFVGKIGDTLLSTHVLALEVMALLLTAAMLGGVIIAMKVEGEPSSKPARNGTADEPS